MPNRRSIDPYEAAKLMDQGMTTAEVGKVFGCTSSGVYQALRTIDYVPKKQRSHKKAIPWTLAKGHRRSTVAVNLRRLSTLAQGGTLQSGKKNHVYVARSVVAWANRILDDGMDVDYDEEEPPNEFSSVGGFFLKEADRSNWHIDKLMSEVRRVQSRIK